MNRKLSTLKDAENALKPYIPLVKELTGKDTVMDRIVPLMEFLGHPENQIKTIHIAGTSGKTSTAYYISALLTLSGKHVGLTVSPHIDKVTERTQINGQPISDSDFCNYLSEFLDLVTKSGIKPSYFELLYAFSIWLFARLKVDYAVIETGVGGLYDATNVVTREDKICVLTDIGFDHMHLLGNTLKDIAAQKVGIVHEHNVLLMYNQDSEIMQVVKSWVKDHQAELRLTSQESERKKYKGSEEFYKLPQYQQRNWLLAYYVYRYTAKRDGLKTLSDAELSNSQTTLIPARMDISEVNNHILVMDGAHNFQKIETFTRSYSKMFPGVKPAILVAFKSDKAYVEALPLLNRLAAQIIVTTFKFSEDIPVSSSPPEAIARELEKLGAKNVVIEQNNIKAYELLLKSPSKYLIITGSFYLIAQIRQHYHA